MQRLQGHAGRDANENRFLKTCDIAGAIPESLARRAALLRRLVLRGSPLMHSWWRSRNPEGVYLHPIRATWRAPAAQAADVLIEQI
jgi:hypothetical protein